VLLFVWYRHGNREAGWLIIPSLLPAAIGVLYDLGTTSIYFGWGRLDFLIDPIPLGPISLNTSDAGNLLFLLAIGFVMFFRFTRVSREQARAAAELEAAREIQRRLVPSSLPVVPGYRIEAAYVPAQEVGGDFYQVIERADRSLLVVVGDVSGKGLKAAMTGTLAIGALRTLCGEGLGPAELLTRLNLEMLRTEDGGFITCLCARLSHNGTVAIANAGHLAPYRNGGEVEVNSGLPLGIAAEAEYAETGFQLGPGDALMLLSDGVVEARNAAGELFGFERTAAISTEPAEKIAQTAQAFGQEDDITVLTLTFTPIGVAHA
jgi:serine phosphatase RsbU (regulator of sigma subunit)